MCKIREARFAKAAIAFAKFLEIISIKQICDCLKNQS